MINNFSLERREGLKRLGAGALALTTLSSFAQNEWPNKPVRWIVPFAPGGTSNIVARAVANELTKQMGVPFLIDNKGGGGGVPSMQEIVRTPADGYTLILGHIGYLAVNPLIYPDSGYVVNKDFAPVTLLAKVPSLFVVHKDVPVKDFKGFVN